MEIKGLLGKYYTVKEVATLCGVAQPTVYNWCNNGTLSCYKVGGTIRIYEVHLQAFLKGMDTFALPSTVRL